MMSVLSNYLLLAFVVVSTLYHHQQGWPPQKGGGLAFGAALPEIDEIESDYSNGAPRNGTASPPSHHRLFKRQLDPNGSMPQPRPPPKRRQRPRGPYCNGLGEEPPLTFPQPQQQPAANGGGDNGQFKNSGWQQGH